MASWQSLFSFHPPTHPRLSFLPPGGWISKAEGGVGNGFAGSAVRRKKRDCAQPAHADIIVVPRPYRAFVARAKQILPHSHDTSGASHKALSRGQHYT